MWQWGITDENGGCSGYGTFYKILLHGRIQNGGQGVSFGIDNWTLLCIISWGDSLSVGLGLHGAKISG